MTACPLWVISGPDSDAQKCPLSAISGHRYSCSFRARVESAKRADTGKGGGLGSRWIDCSTLSYSGWDGSPSAPEFKVSIISDGSEIALTPDKLH